MRCSPPCRRRTAGAAARAGRAAAAKCRARWRRRRAAASTPAARAPRRAAGPRCRGSRRSTRGRAVGMPLSLGRVTRAARRPSTGLAARIRRRRYRSAASAPLTAVARALRSRMTLAGILFDKDGTLVDFDATWGGAAHAVMQHMSAGDRARLRPPGRSHAFRRRTRRFRPTSPMIAGSTADYGPALGRDPRAPVRAPTCSPKSIGASPMPALESLSAARRTRGRVFAVLQRAGPAARHRHQRRRGERAGAMRAARAAAPPRFHRRLRHRPRRQARSRHGHGLRPPYRRRAATGSRSSANSIHDLEAARAAGALSMAVLSGPAGRAVLEPHADHVIDTIADLPALLARLDPPAAPARAG